MKLLYTQVEKTPIIFTKLHTIEQITPMYYQFHPNETSYSLSQRLMLDDDTHKHSPVCKQHSAKSLSRPLTTYVDTRTQYAAQLRICLGLQCRNFSALPHPTSF